MKRVLAVGAFERDNLGDILFYFLVRKLFEKHHVRAAGTVYGDMRPYFGEVVLPYNHLLSTHTWDVVVVVGGEIGGVDIDSALQMALSKENEATLLQMIDRNPARHFLACADYNQMAYLPDIRSFENNKDTVYCVNSIGLSKLTQIGAHPFVTNTIEVLKQVNRLSVRDSATLSYLESCGIQARLAPDCIHALSRYFPDELENPPVTGDRSYLVFQMIGDLVESWDYRPIALALARVAANHRLNVIFLASGTANHHDHYAHYVRLANQVREIDEHIDVEVFFDRNVFAIASRIRSASLWIGTSLHGWVLSMSAGVPRVALKNDKVAPYARLWDGLFPVDICLDELEDACAQALTVPAHIRYELAAHVSGKADQNIKDMFGEYL